MKYLIFLSIYVQRLCCCRRLPSSVRRIITTTSYLSNPLLNHFHLLHIQRISSENAQRSVLLCLIECVSDIPRIPRGNNRLRNAAAHPRLAVRASWRTQHKLELPTRRTSSRRSLAIHYGNLPPVLRRYSTHDKWGPFRRIRRRIADYFSSAGSNTCSRSHTIYTHDQYSFHPVSGGYGSFLTTTTTPHEGYIHGFHTLIPLSSLPPSLLTRYKLLILAV